MDIVLGARPRGGGGGGKDECARARVAGVAVAWTDWMSHARSAHLAYGDALSGVLGAAARSVAVGVVGSMVVGAVRVRANRLSNAMRQRAEARRWRGGATVAPPNPNEDGTLLRALFVAGGSCAVCVCALSCLSCSDVPPALLCFFVCCVLFFIVPDAVS